jgi:hypothetical protein
MSGAENRSWKQTRVWESEDTHEADSETQKKQRSEASSSNARVWETIETHDRMIEEEEEKSHADYCGVMFVSKLVDMNATGKKMSAKDLCVLCYWASGAKIHGPAQSFALKPDLEQSGHYQRKLDSALDVQKDDPRYFNLTVSLNDKYDEKRSSRQILVQPAHESLEAEYEKGPHVLQSMVEGQEWAQDYWDHPVVKLSQENKEPLPLPFALYLDGTPFINDDSFLAFLIYNLVTGVRHMCVVVRKSELCACGCHNWCTLYVIFNFLHWCFLALAMKSYPTARPDGRVWDASKDAGRMILAGTAMKLRACLLQIKGDWAEFAHSLGFPTWSSNMFPCIFCNCTRDNMWRA